MPSANSRCTGRTNISKYTIGKYAEFTITADCVVQTGVQGRNKRVVDVGWERSSYVVVSPENLIGEGTNISKPVVRCLVNVEQKRLLEEGRVWLWHLGEWRVCVCVSNTLVASSPSQREFHFSAKHRLEDVSFPHRFVTGCQMFPPSTPHPRIL